MEGIKILRATGPHKGHGLRLATYLEGLLHELDIHVHQTVRNNGLIVDGGLWGYNHVAPHEVQRSNLKSRWYAHERMLIATRNTIPVGLLLYKYNPKTKHLHICDFVVTVKERGKGIGQELIARARDIAKAKGLARVTLGVHHGNVAAEHIYHKLGFRTRYKELELVEAAVC